LVYTIKPAKLKSIMPLRGKFKPKSGPEKAFGMYLREIGKLPGCPDGVYKHCGIDRTYLSAIERGIRVPPCG